MWTGPWMRIQKMTISEHQGSQGRKWRIVVPAIKEVIPSSESRHPKADEWPGPAIDWAPPMFKVSDSPLHLIFITRGLFQSPSEKWGHWIPGRLDPTSDCPNPISSLLSSLTSLSTGTNIFTPISNHVEVLAPFTSQLKMQALEFLLWCITISGDSAAPGCGVWSPANTVG